MRYEYSVSFQDFSDSLKAFRQRSIGLTVFYIIHNWLLPALGLSFLGVYAYYAMQRDAAFLNDYFAIACLALLLVIVMPLAYRARVKQSYKQRTAITDGGHVVLEFDEQNVSFSIPGKANVIYEWQTFTEYVESATVGTLFVDKSAFHTIPKSALDQDGRQEFLRLANAKITERS